jgi:hypothetical protein
MPQCGIRIPQCGISCQEENFGEKPGGFDLAGPKEPGQVISPPFTEGLSFENSPSFQAQTDKLPLKCCILGENPKNFTSGSNYCSHSSYFPFFKPLFLFI